METPRMIITISREFGTGGRAAALKLGEMLGLKVYDKTILRRLTDQFNLTPEEIECVKAKRTHWWDDFCNFYHQFDFSNSSVSEEHHSPTSLQLYYAEAQIVRDLAKQESCIVVGRCGFHIFKDDPHVAKFLITASLAHRLQRITSKYGLSEEEAMERIRTTDEARENYSKAFAGVSRYDARNYDMALNADRIHTDYIAAFLAEIVRRKSRLEV